MFLRSQSPNPFLESIRPALVCQPPQRGFFAEDHQTIVETDPIRVRHRLHYRVSLLGECPERRSLLRELGEPILNRLASGAISGVGIHRSESFALGSAA